MLSSLKKMRGDKKGWYKVSDLRPGVEIAVPSQSPVSSLQHLEWDEIVSIKPVGREQVYDIEVEGTHNFVGNGIFAHNTYVLRANTMLAVTGEVNAGSFTVPIGSATDATSTSALGREIPSAVLTADGKGVDLYKLATYNLASVGALGTKVDEQGVRITALETRVDKLESGAVSSASGTPTFSTSTLITAFNELGAFISKGFAQFGTLIADRFVAAVDSAGTSSAGTVTVLAGNTVALVTNAYVTPATKIFITFNSAVTGSWYVSDKQENSFKVVLSEIQTTDVSFDYFLVQTEGQLKTTDSGTGSQTSDASSGSLTSPDSGQVPASPDATEDTEPDVASTTTETSTPDPAPTTPSADSTAPVVTLVGEVAVEINAGDAFTDPGATATDDTDGDLTTHIIVSGAVDTATAGLYTITYTATDAAGNSGSVSRVVTVLASASSPQVVTEPTPAEPAPTTDTTPTP